MIYQQFSISVLTDAELAKCLATKCSGETLIDLINISLDTKEYLRVFKALPKNITSIKLDGGSLGRKPTEEIIQIFKSIPEGINTLDLDNNFFNQKSTDLVKQLISALPINIKFLRTTEDFDNLDQCRSLIKIQSTFTRLTPLLLILKDKTDGLKTRKCNEAYHAANALHETLTKLKTKWEAGEYEGDIFSNYSEFKSEAIQSINVARIDLEKHRGWKELLANIALCILGLGVVYLAICAYKGSFFKFNTDSIDKLNELQNTIELEMPSPSR